MKLSQFKFKLPEDSIALNPPYHRDECRLMVLHRVSQKIEMYKTDEKGEPLKDEEGNVIGTETVPSADIDYVAGALKDAGIIEYEFLFKLFAKFSKADEKVDPGTYELSTNFDYRALVTKMQTGSASQLQTLITIPEGYTVPQIADQLEKSGVCSAEEFIQVPAE